MFSATHVNQVEITSSLNQFALHTGQACNSQLAGSYAIPFLATERPHVRKNLCELLRAVGKNPQLIGALAAKRSQEEKINLLIHHQLIVSKDDLPTKEEVKREQAQLAAVAPDQDEQIENANGACSLIAFGGSYES